jgi:hypothetical protein
LGPAGNNAAEKHPREATLSLMLRREIALRKTESGEYRIPPLGIIRPGDILPPGT